MLKQLKCGNCGQIDHWLYAKEHSIAVVCANCGEVTAETWPTAHRGTPLDPNGPQAVGTAGNEPAHMGTKTEGTQG